MNRRQMIVGTGALAVAASPVRAVAPFASDRFTVRVEGSGPDVILIPGLSSQPAIWDGLVSHWGGRVRTHRLQLNGFAGLPPSGNRAGPVSAPVAEEVARYIAEVGLTRPAVIGHSMGGTIGLMLAARHPERVGRLMVVDMLPSLAPAFAGPMATREQIEAVGRQVHDGLAASTGQARIDSATQTLAGMIRTEARRAGPIRDSLASDPDVMARAMQELIVTDLAPELSRIKAPTTVLYVTFPGAGDAMTAGFYAMGYRALDGVRLVHIPDSAHFIMLDQPERFESEADAFLSAS